MRDLQIATATSAMRKLWNNEIVSWGEFVNRLAKTHYTHETVREYKAMSKAEQGAIKDVGGYVAGYLFGGKRSKAAVLRRSMLTLDLDFANLDFCMIADLMFDFEYVIHSTHKHTPETPRYRLIVPLSRDVTPEEYGAVSRRIAGKLGIELFDKTTFEVNRLMFYPSTSKDGEYVFDHKEGDFLNPDDVLKEYNDWTDVEEWDYHADMLDTRRMLKEVQNPLEKQGVIGAFCRTYSISQALDTFLPDVYSATDDPTRYSYCEGSTAKGLVVYDDLLAYSFHGTDPINGSCVNAFDLVRIHKFGSFDSENKKSVEPTKLQSYKLMEALVLADGNVTALMIQERRQAMEVDFTSEIENAEDLTLEEQEANLAKKLICEKNGKVVCDARNLRLIFNLDPHLKGKIKYNDFDKRRYIMEDLPFMKVDKPTVIGDHFYGCLRNYLDEKYGIQGTAKIDDCLMQVFEENKFHPVKQYLDSLVWDKKNRIDELLIRCFGATDNKYSREVIRKSLVAAVSRIYNAGCKYDNVLVLVGAQGTKKSSFFAKLGKQWFSDTFSTVAGKEAFEQIQGKWIIEIAELAGLKKAEVETTKHFISKTCDYYRPAYGRSTEEYHRQCVFFGTTNNYDFLKDTTGNRRFSPVDVHPERVTLDVFSKEFDGMIDQIWAEAVWLYEHGESLLLSNEAEQGAITERENHTDIDERTGIVDDYLEQLYPVNWGSMDIFERRNWLSSDELQKKGTERKNVVCALEVWCEVLNRDREDFTKHAAREVNDMLRSLKGWKLAHYTLRLPKYGKQRVYERIGYEANDII